MSLLAGGERVGVLGHGGNQRFVICVDCKLSSFQVITELLHCQVNAEKFSVESTVLSFWRPELAAEKCQRLPRTVNLLF